MKSFDDKIVVVWKKIARAVLDGNRQQFRDSFIEAGLVVKPHKVDFDAQWDAALVLYRPILAGDGFRFSRDYIDEMNKALVYKNKNRRYLNLPPDWLFANRLQWGLYAVLAHLNVTVNYGDMYREALAMGPE